MAEDHHPLSLLSFDHFLLFFFAGIYHYWIFSQGTENKTHIEAHLIFFNK